MKTTHDNEVIVLDSDSDEEDGDRKIRAAANPPHNKRKRRHNDNNDSSSVNGIGENIDALITRIITRIDIIQYNHHNVSPNNLLIDANANANT